MALFGREVGSKPGSGPVPSQAMSNLQRRERLRQLAMETVDLANDPYFMKNHLGSYECKLCLTLHTNEGSYLAHTQGKRHQQNLARREAMLSMQRGYFPDQEKPKVQPRKTQKIGRPGYKVIKLRDGETKQRGLLFQIYYPKIEEGLQPRTRMMGAFEQKVEKPDPNYQYLLFAAEPYETIAFKIPKLEIDKKEGHFLTNWDNNSNAFTLQLLFK